MRICSFLLIAFTFTFCSDLNKTKQMEQLQRISSSLDSIKLVLKNTGKQSLLDSFTSGKKALSDLTPLIKLDTITDIEASQIAAFSTNLEELSNLITVYDELLIQLKTEKKTVNSLNKDIAQGYGQRHKYNSFISFERKKMKKIIRHIEEFIEMKGKVIEQIGENSLILKEMYLAQLSKKSKHKSHH